MTEVVILQNKPNFIKFEAIDFRYAHTQGKIRTHVTAALKKRVRVYIYKTAEFDGLLLLLIH